MKSYKLITLLKVRERNKDLAERSLFDAKRQLEEEQEKLRQIQEQLLKNKAARAEMQNHFFYKAQSDPCNKREVTSLAFSSQKNICDEQSLRNSLLEQIEQVKMAESKTKAANNHVLETNRELKTINKHRVMWQQREKRNEDLKVEYDADDQNSVRFWLNKRA